MKGMVQQMAQPGKARPGARTTGAQTPTTGARVQPLGADEPTVSAATSTPKPLAPLSGAKGGDDVLNQRITVAERRAQRAAEAQQARRGRQRRNILLGVIGAVVLLLAAGYFLREQYLTQQTGVAVPDEGSGHIAAGTELTFAHYPPSSGTHYPSAQPAGVYRQEVPEGSWVHSLEHGYVAILVRCTTDCNAIYDRLDQVYKNLPNSKYGSVKLVVTPYSKPYTDGDSPLMLMAWGHEQRLNTVDRDTITRFYKKFVDKGPEDIP
jgi:hypothetical protein